MSVRGVSVACSLVMARTVSVKLLKIDGTPIVGAVLPFDQMSGSYTSQSQQPPDRKLSSPTDSQGVASVLLWENATGLLPNYVRLTLPESDEPVDFAVPAGTGPLDLVSRLDPPGAGTQGTRIITGTVNHNHGTPWAGGVISVTLENFCYTSQAIYPAGSIQITLDANGSFIQSVFANGGATNDSLMRWELPNSDVFWVRIPLGTAPLTLSFLRGLAVDPPIPSPPPAYVTPVVTAATVLAMIENHNLNPAAHPGGIAGGVGGGGLPTYEHTQSSMSTAWAISHNLGRKPSITTYAADGGVIEGQIVHHSNTAATAVFAIAVSGFAYCV